ncbi:hypothetical protein EJ04DRAFT_507348 [Polyplosphaeria fusca]|uniref:MYND-type domain-containing protein n=1 Tax=Polyplosphaeria fusca TaxID=682080 RepID=A0A9P4R7X6_9PLEO|nr:hypothetical protein EJ04DRAFT_507348 [Polyplosphaeria fusca]
MSDPSPCSRCNRYPDHNECAFQHCGRCRARHYCSRECQRVDWKEHKGECRSIANGLPAPTGAFGEAKADSIYFLKTTFPHIKDISVSGPYHPLELVIPQMAARLQYEGSKPGLDMLKDRLESTDTTNMMHLEAPLPNGHVMEMQIQRYKNPEVAAFLRDGGPGKAKPTYSVLCSTPDPEFDNLDDVDESDEGNLPLLAASMHGTFLSNEAAIESARVLLTAWEREFPGSRVYTLPGDDGMLGGSVVGKNGLPIKILKVHYDDGSTVHHNVKNVFGA